METSVVDMPLIRPELLSILACPYCDSPDLRYQHEAAQLVCQGCTSTFAFENRIPMVYKDDEFWRPKQREAQGWVDMWKEMGIYEQEHQIDTRIPFLPEQPWASIGRMFQEALFQMSRHSGARVLDIGAGQGWASQQFAQRGCHAVAMDIVPDMVLGLGRAWKIMEASNTVFDLIVGDNERMPFQPGSFDYVFSCGTLHHSDNLDKLFQSAFRVLRPGGKIIAIGDPLTSLFQQEEDMHDGDREKEHGIIERRRRVYDYVGNCWRAGFRNIHIEDEQTFWRPYWDLYPWLDQQRYQIEQYPLFGSTRTTRTLTSLMMRLPRPFAVALLLALRQGGLLLISGQKRA